jgi:hypothetical protein
MGCCPSALACRAGDSICLASVSCVLAPIICMGFCASFSRLRFSQGWQRLLVPVPTVLFGLPLVASSIAMIYHRRSGSTLADTAFPGPPCA